MNNREKEDSLTLGILEAIDDRDDVTQRHLAERMGVALGLANSYLKRCVNKGLIKIHQAPANRYLYYLTPKGFAEKSRLTAEYLSSSFDFYRKASESMTASFEACQFKGWQNIVFCGVSEVAEIASVRINETELTHLATYDPDTSKSRYLGHEIWKSFENHQSFDACVITSLSEPLAMYERVAQVVDKEKIVIPDLFGISI